MSVAVDSVSILDVAVASPLVEAFVERSETQASTSAPPNLSIIFAPPPDRKRYTVSSVW